MKKTIAGVDRRLRAGFAGQALAQEKLTVWWVKGFYKSEDDALFAAIKKFEAKHRRSRSSCRSTRAGHDPEDGGRARLGQPARRRLRRRLRLPGHRQVGLRRQARGHHQRASTRCAPVRAERARDDLPLQRPDEDRAYYAFPIKQQTMHIEYWIDMLADAGFKESDIPTGWKDYWSFWCDKVQAGYRQKTGNRGFGIGMPLGVDSSDSFFSFLTFMDAYNVKLGQRRGKLLVDDPPCARA
jgi:multiple sugar transport system substrate-binding protein